MLLYKHSTSKVSITCSSYLFAILSFLLLNFHTNEIISQQTPATYGEGFAYVNSQPPKLDGDEYKEVYYQEGMSSQLEEKTNLILEDIFFAYGDDEILPQSEYVLQDVIRVLNDNPHLAIELSAHTDSRGTLRYNERLSKNRARNLVKYLTRNGVDGARLISIGLGESTPKNHCSDGILCSEEEHQVNRRIEMRTATMINNLPTRQNYIYKY